MERILANEAVVAEGAQPRFWLYVLHGIFGSGRNWGTVARRVVRQRPEWGAVLVDLRQHGASLGFSPPHTIAAAADDLAALVAAREGEASAVLGHSFGGKVALAYAALEPSGLRQIWVIDSSPEAKPPGGSAWRMLEVVRGLPDAFATRDELIDDLEAAGFPRGTGQWMATSLERSDGALHWRFDIDSIEALMLDFFRRDFWPVIEGPPAGVEIRVVKATESSVLGESSVVRIQKAGRHGTVSVQEIDGGHWLNADNPDAIVDLLVAQLPRD
jgi:pimeloyl-ACP methyl ester carboxylesterase